VAFKIYSLKETGIINNLNYYITINNETLLMLSVFCCQM